MRCDCLRRSLPVSCPRHISRLSNAPTHPQARRPVLISAIRLVTVSKIAPKKTPCPGSSHAFPSRRTVPVPHRMYKLRSGTGGVGHISCRWCRYHGGAACSSVLPCFPPSPLRQPPTSRQTPYHHTPFALQNDPRPSFFNCLPVARCLCATTSLSSFQSFRSHPSLISRGPRN